MRPRPASEKQKKKAAPNQFDLLDSIRRKQKNALPSNTVSRFAAPTDPVAEPEPVVGAKKLSFTPISKDRGVSSSPLTRKTTKTLFNNQRVGARDVPPALISRSSSQPLPSAEAEAIAMAAASAVVSAAQASGHLTVPKRMDSLHTQRRHSIHGAVSSLLDIRHSPIPFKRKKRNEESPLFSEEESPCTCPPAPGASGDYPAPSSSHGGGRQDRLDSPAPTPKFRTGKLNGDTRQSSSAFSSFTDSSPFSKKQNNGYPFAGSNLFSWDESLVNKQSDRSNSLSMSLPISPSPNILEGHTSRQNISPSTLILNEFQYLPATHGPPPLRPAR